MLFFIVVVWNFYTDVHFHILGGNGGGGKELGIENDPSEGLDGGSAEAWGEWTDWSECTTSCGDNSLRFRRRSCVSSIPADCLGESIQIEPCYVQPC